MSQKQRNYLWWASLNNHGTYQSKTTQVAPASPLGGTAKGEKLYCVRRTPLACLRKSVIPLIRKSVNPYFRAPSYIILQPSYIFSTHLSLWHFDISQAWMMTSVLYFFPSAAVSFSWVVALTTSLVHVALYQTIYNHKPCEIALFIFLLKILVDS